MKKTTTTPSTIPTQGLYGILLLIVCVSIAYMAFLVWNGTDGLVNKIMVIPGVTFVITYLVLKAWK